LPIESKVFEKFLLKRHPPLVEHANLIPHQQFGFRPRHSTTEQAHYIIRVLSDALGNSQYSSAQAQTITTTHLLPHLQLLSNRHFVVKVNTELTGLTPVNAGVPQGSVLGPLLYLPYTADIQPRLTPSLLPLPTILQSSPLTVILPLIPKNCKSPSSLFNPGYVIGELKLMRLSWSMWHSLQDETRAHRFM
jgi:hypothetical protein